MSSASLPMTTVEKIAVQIEGDIRLKGLRPGDRYLTASEASELFEVNSMTMHRAMHSLAGREVLVRKRSRGTFVGPKFGATGHVNSNQAKQAIDVLHVVMAIDYHRAQNFSSDTLVDELSRAIPGVTIQVHHLVENGALKYIDQQLERISSSKREGFVLIRCTREVQKRISDSKLPAVVFGHVYPGVCLSCIRHDQQAVGHYMAEYALEQGARRFALLTHARWRLGDHKMIDAATKQLSAAGVQLDEVKIRSVVPEREVVREVVQEIFESSEQPDAFLCRSDFYAHVVNEMIQERNQSGAGSVTNACVVSGSHSPPNGGAQFARVTSSCSLTEQVEHITKLLTQQTVSQQNTIATRTEPNDSVNSLVIPVEFEVPKRKVRSKD